MAIWKPWTAADEASWEEWVSTRPLAVQELARRFPPNRLYRLGKDRCYVYSYFEDGTLSVAVTGQFNRVLFSRHVFGIKPEDLTECELPSPDEDLGDTAAEAGYSEDDIRTILIPKIKAQMRRRSKSEIALKH